MSSIQGVRDALLDKQRRLAAQGAVAVGRDCGTVVFPDATLKLYLDASQDVRAQRRASQLGGSGGDANSALMHGEVRARDATDASRAAAPMQPARDAHLLDTGILGIDEVYREALSLWEAVAGAVKR
jgi:cytidylate kinase